MPPESADSVPKTMRVTYEEITRATDQCCQAMLDEEYAEICRLMAAALCRKRPSPLAQGRVASWTAGIVHAAGFVNFLWDPDQKPYMSAPDIAKCVGVAYSTTVARSKIIQRVLGLYQLDPRYCRQSLLKENPYVWFIETTSGVIVDARTQPRAVQEALVAAGVIPFVYEAPSAAPEASDARHPEPKAKAPKPENPNQGWLFE